MCCIRGTRVRVKALGFYAHPYRTDSDRDYFSSDKCTYSKSLWIKASAKRPACKHECNASLSVALQTTASFIQLPLPLHVSGNNPAILEHHNDMSLRIMEHGS